MKVSVLIPAFNCEAWLQRCVDSILLQSYRNLEILIYDDGSSDTTPEISLQFEKLDSRISFFSAPHKGIGYARNQLMQAAGGDAILFVDADDWIEPDMIEILVGKLNVDKLDICSCNVAMDSGQSKTILYAAKKEYCVLRRKDVVKDYLKLKPLHGSLCNKLISAQKAKAVHFNSECMYAEDSTYLWNLIQTIDRVGLIPLPLYHYCRHEGSLSDWKFSETKMSHVMEWEMILDQVKNRYPQYLSTARCSFAGLITSYLYLITTSDYCNTKTIDRLRYLLRQNIRQYYPLVTKRFLHVAFAQVCLLSWSAAKMINRFLHKTKNICRPVFQ